MEGDVESCRGVDMPCAVVCPVEVTLLSELFISDIILCKYNSWISLVDLEERILKIVQWKAKNFT